MPSILARQDALVFVDKSKITSSSTMSNEHEEDALFWSPGILIGEKERDMFFNAMKVRSRPEIELDKHQVLVCFFEDAS